MRRLLRATVAVVGAWCAWRLAGPEMQVRYSVPQRRPLRLPGRTVFVGDREFFVREAGPVDAPVLVLLHGWSLDGEMAFHRLIPQLEDRYRLVIPDQRNHGRSDWIRSQLEIDDLADDMAGLATALGIGSATVFGFSLGGMVAQRIAVRHPRLVTRLVLGGTAARPVDRFRFAAWATLRAGRLVARISRKELSLATTLALRSDDGLDAQHVRWMYEGLMRRDAGLYYEAGFAAWRFDGRDDLSKISVPTKVLIPSADQVVPARAQRDMADRIPGSIAVELPGARHESIISQPDDYAREIREFVPTG